MVPPWPAAPDQGAWRPRDDALRRHPPGQECPGAEIADYGCLALQSFQSSVAHKFHERAIRIPKIDRRARSFCPKPLHRTALYGNAMLFQVSDRVFNGSLPFET